MNNQQDTGVDSINQSPTTNALNVQTHQVAAKSHGSANMQQLVLEQQALINQLKHRLQQADRQSALKDKELSSLKDSVFGQGQKITSLQKQVQNLQKILTKLTSRRDKHYKPYLEQKSNVTSYKTYPLQSMEQFESFRDKPVLLNLSEVSLTPSRKNESYMQSSRIGGLSNSRKSRREELMQCQNLTDVYKLPEYRHG